MLADAQAHLLQKDKQQMAYSLPASPVPPPPPPFPSALLLHPFALPFPLIVYLIVQ